MLIIRFPVVIGKKKFKNVFLRNGTEKLGNMVDIQKIFYKVRYAIHQSHRTSPQTRSGFFGCLMNYFAQCR